MPWLSHHRLTAGRNDAVALARSRDIAASILLFVKKSSCLAHGVVLVTCLMTLPGDSLGVPTNHHLAAVAAIGHQHGNIGVMGVANSASRNCRRVVAWQNLARALQRGDRRGRVAPG